MEPFDFWKGLLERSNEALAYEHGRIAALLKQRDSLKARAERAEARLQQLLEHGHPTWAVKGAPKSQWSDEGAYLAVDHVLNVVEDRFVGPRRRDFLLARESWEALYGRAQGAELEIAVVVARAESAAAALAAARAEGAATERARIAAEIAALATEPDSTGQVLTPRRSPATLAALREVARMLVEAQPAGEVSDG